jgi:hypothetical protein
MVELPRACIGGLGPCSGYALPGRSRCLAHSRKSDGWAKYAAKHPDRSAFYRSERWRALRDAQLHEHPDCVVCGQRARHADHIVPLSAGGDFGGPLQSLCKEHHRRKTQNESKAGNKRAAARRRQRD